MKVIVYTCNLGGYDVLRKAPKPIEDFRYLYYTDQEAPDGWEKMTMKSGGRRESRFYKINSHLLPEHDISIYVDANAYWGRSPFKMVEYIKGFDIAIPPHPNDRCVYKHALTCMRLNLDAILPILKQVGKYANEGMPENIGLTENGLIIRANNPKVKELNELWWKEYQAGSQRDQLSMPYALWRTQPKLKILPFSARENKWFSNNLIHLKSRHE